MRIKTAQKAQAATNQGPRQFEILMHKEYPIGHGTGLTKDEWREFAEEYKRGVFNMMRLSNSQIDEMDCIQV